MMQELATNLLGLLYHVKLNAMIQIQQVSINITFILVYCCQVAKMLFRGENCSAVALGRSKDFTNSPDGTLTTLTLSNKHSEHVFTPGSILNTEKYTMHTSYVLCAIAPPKQRAVAAEHHVFPLQFISVMNETVSVNTDSKA